MTAKDAAGLVARIEALDPAVQAEFINMLDKLLEVFGELSARTAEGTEGEGTPYARPCAIRLNHARRRQVAGKTAWTCETHWVDFLAGHDRPATCPGALQ
jgi:hypothetical protein